MTECSEKARIAKMEDRLGEGDVILKELMMIAKSTDAKTDRIESQTTITNGRVNGLEKRESNRKSAAAVGLICLLLGIFVAKIGILGAIEKLFSLGLQ